MSSRFYGKVVGLVCGLDVYGETVGKFFGLLKDTLVMWV